MYRKGEPIPLAIHPALRKYFLKLETADSVDHDYDLPKEELTSSAVYPPMLSLKLKGHQYPQIISIEASDDSQGVGVTVQDVLRTLHGVLRMPILTHESAKLGAEEWAMDSALGEGPSHPDQYMADVYANSSQRHHLSSPAAVYPPHLDYGVVEVRSPFPLRPAQGSRNTSSGVGDASAPDLPLSMELNREVTVSSQLMRKKKLDDLETYTLDKPPDFTFGVTDPSHGNLMDFTFDPIVAPGNENMLAAMQAIQSPTWLGNMMMPGSVDGLLHVVLVGLHLASLQILLAGRRAERHYRKWYSR